MEEELLDRNPINLNVSEFDDSIISEEDEPKLRFGNSLFMKSNSELNNDVIVKNNLVPNNLEISNPESMTEIKKDKTIENYEQVMLEDIFSNKYEIPMSLPTKFSKSKMGHQFIYESKINLKKTNYKIESRKFGLERNSQITTYLLSIFIFSEFINLDEIEKDKRLNVIFLKQNKIQKQFVIEDKTSFLKNLDMPEHTVNDFDMFINGMNDFLGEKDYLNIQKKNKNKIISIYSILTLIILFIIGLCVSLYLTNKQLDDGKKKTLICILEIILLVIFLVLLIFKIIDVNNLKILLIFYELRYLIINYNRYCQHIELWNKNLFENYKIAISIPISLNYIMFNLNPYQNIEIKHLDLNWMKKKFYKSQYEIFKTEKEAKLFKTINQNVIVLKNRNSLSIN